jgi:hypothetical protein
VDVTLLVWFPCFIPTTAKLDGREGRGEVLKRQPKLSKALFRLPDTSKNSQFNGDRPIRWNITNCLHIWLYLDILY